MTDCIRKLSFPHYKKRRLEADFSGGDLSSDGGFALLGQIESHTQLVSGLSDHMQDPRSPDKIQHSQVELLSQRIFQICSGYEDGNDSTFLRHDPMLKLACQRLPSDNALGSQSTFSRLENRVTLKDISSMRRLFVDRFIASFAVAPKEIVLDIDGFDVPTHGQQEFTFYHGYYHHYVYYPVMINDAHTGYPLVLQLRAGNSHAGKGVASLLRWLFWRLRKAFPSTSITLRGDGGFSLPEIITLCERSTVTYIFGYSGNSVLKRKSENLTEQARLLHCQTGNKVRLFDDVYYKAGSWPYPRRIIMKAEWLEKGSNNRFIVTNCEGDPQALYDRCYVLRGECSENRIKELKLDMKTTRLSCTQFISNQFRLFLHQAAYIFLLEIKKLLHGTRYAKARMVTIRERLLKCAVRVTLSVRRVLIQFASSCPEQDIISLIHQRMTPL
jgi:hypothetical protein